MFVGRGMQFPKWDSPIFQASPCIPIFVKDLRSAPSLCWQTLTLTCGMQRVGPLRTVIDLGFAHFFQKSFLYAA